MSNVATSRSVEPADGFCGQRTIHAHGYRTRENSR